MIDYKRLKEDDEYAVAEHRKMWRWLAKHPTKDKLDYFEMFNIDYHRITNGCFLCENNDCCLLEWTDANGNAGGLGCVGDYSCGWEGLFSAYLQSDCHSLKIKYANMIAELKGVNKEYEGRGKIFKSEKY